MPFKLYFTQQADSDLSKLEDDPTFIKRLKAVRKCLAWLEMNPRHPGLNTHKFSSLAGPNDEEIFEAYAENRTPGAYRVFWYYGPNRQEITILAITPHP